MKWALTAALVLTGCAHSGRKPGAGNLAQTIPPGCDKSVAGTWVHENNGSYQYTATDDGSVAHFLPRRVNPDGTLVIDPQDKTAEMAITFQRRAEGFVGEFHLMQTMDDGKQCGVLFETRLTACSPDRLAMQVEQSYAVNQSCERIDFGQSDIVEHVLLRVKP